MDLDVVNMFVIAGGTLAIPILAFVASFLLWPSALIRIYYWYWRRALGMQVRYVQHEDYQFCYSFRGRPGHRPSVLLLHGFSAHKDMWLSLVKFLPKNLHLICVDMPGHEGTTRSPLDDLSIDGQVKRIHQFVECLKLNKKPFHLMGTSMGGNVAGVYAAYYPSDIGSLTLVCPAGLQYPTDNQFVRRLRELQESAAVEKIPLIPSTPEEMSEMLQLCSYVRFKVPQQILQGLVDVRIPHNNFYRKLFLEIINEKSRYSLHQNMDKIKAPTQIIWGKQDQVQSGLEKMPAPAATYERIVYKNPSEHHYMKVCLEFQEHGVGLNVAQFKQLLISALKDLFGEVDAALPLDILTYEEETLSAILRICSSGLVRLWSSLTLLGSYKGKKCAFRVIQVSPFLLALSGNSRELVLD
ncbi:monoacylglycerol lipase ABHD6 isoform X1 [Myotis lucifugus]|uniref:monoacylglycerol lipase ABHD6 isoform X1 n=1 Tax=Myotis lucifugus TaxID=59463 RepID=UPI000CCC50B8|nr:monoacylglycerol lipase ABHD6 isoform X1 [Myotis lucifugus]XP_023620757.1 monoacylglycerol lipase ABHD6 isoform X1 [Myotis lucifugus]XP_023620758.1 monoacylglycerol lipase ABHD6 isoform X1 [Myotis lucifugus]XP_023620759.1 monoacylglycerol lipase ABHD6 isoform X1 [Myotis lucifugus]XP_023620760.1 monoacylglycerol lipase ABHD6 isoform X1 [Myotis lucifugus]XP_023620761.1 monoacylglycerol lipase ABHD6 isoform X1 [Myotis lucifugus]XP_023620765.1 monoacylglycerol lipase ABHD6 isoform X1 [Myotis l